MPRSPVERRLLVVSPHPDDAALSVGGLLAALAGWERHVLTLVGRSAYHVRAVVEAAGGANGRGPDAALVDEVSALRRQEDARWAESAGVRLHAGGALDAPLRSPARNPFHQPSRAHVAEVRGEIAVWVERLRPRPVLAPLGVGGHADHLAARRAAEEVASAAAVELLLYEDLPYAAHEASRGDPPPVAGDGWERPISPHLAAKLAGLKAYRSQFEPLIVQRLVADHAGTEGEPVERLWSPAGHRIAAATARALGLRRLRRGTA